MAALSRVALALYAVERTIQLRVLRARALVHLHARVFLIQDRVQLGVRRRSGHGAATCLLSSPLFSAFCARALGVVDSRLGV
jgi:hypothetical protein